MAVKQLSDGNPDGTQMGQNASDKISFHGATTIAQQTLTAVATASASTTVRLRLQELQAAFVATGLVTE